MVGKKRVTKQGLNANKEFSKKFNNVEIRAKQNSKNVPGKTNSDKVVNKKMTTRKHLRGKEVFAENSCATNKANTVLPIRNKINKRKPTLPIRRIDEAEISTQYKRYLEPRENENGKKYWPLPKPEDVEREEHVKRCEDTFNQINQLLQKGYNTICIVSRLNVKFIKTKLATYYQYLIGL